MPERSVTVDGFTIKEPYRGNIVVVYACPDCEEILRSPISDIGITDDCPNCECQFVVPGEKALVEWKKMVAEEQHQEIQKEQERKKLTRTTQISEEDGHYAAFLFMFIFMLSPIVFYLGVLQGYNPMLIIIFGGTFLFFSFLLCIQSP